MIVVKVRDRDIKAAPMGPVTTGSVGLPVRWEFSEEWTGLAKTAVFRGSNTARDVFLTSDECTVPAEVLTAGDGPLEIGVRGVQITHDEDTDEDVLTVVIPTIWGRIERIFDGTVPSQVDPSVQEPDWTDQVKAAAAEALSKATAVEQAAERGDFNGEDGASAYDQAVAGGYEGTEAQFNEELASFKELSEQASDSAQQAASGAFSAQYYMNSAYQARDGANLAKASAETAADQALIRMNSAATSAQAAAATATTFTEQTVPAAVTTINGAKADALTAVGNAQTTAVGAVQQESATQQAAIQQKGEAALANIPADYTDLTEDVADLTEDVADLTEDVADLTEDVAELTEDVDNLKQTTTATTIGPSAIATFDASAANMPLKQLDVDIEPVQNLNGYDKPWPEGGGKNLLKYPYETGTVTKNGVTFTVYNDGSIKVDTAGAAATANADLYFFSSTGSLPLSNGDYIFSSTYDGTLPSDGFYIHAKANASDASYLNISIGDEGLYTVSNGVFYTACIRVLSGRTINNVTVRPMLRLATEADATFEPYSNICPISGWTGCNIVATKNIFDIDNATWVHRYLIAADGTISTNNSYKYCANFTPIIGGRKITVSGTRTSGAAAFGTPISFYDDQKTFLSRISTFSTNGVGGYVQATIDVPDGAAFFRLNFYDVTTPVSDFQIEYGDTATDFSPFSSFEVTFPSEAGTVYGGTLDVVNKKLTVDKAGHIFTGTETFKTDITFGIGYITNPKAAHKGTGGSTTIPSLMCSHLNPSLSYLYKDRIDRTNRVFPWYTGVNLYLLLGYPTGVTSAEEYESYLQQQYAAGTPVTVCYPLDTPIVYDLTADEITTLLGENNIWADAGDVTVTYGAYLETLRASLDRTNSDLANLRACIAPTEDGDTASQTYVQGAYFFRNGSFCVALLAIDSGDQFTLGTNYKVMSVAEAILAMSFVILEQPHDVEASIGVDGTFSVVARGAAGYVWQYWTPNSQAWRDSTTTTSDYTLEVTEARYTYRYRCKVTGLDGSVIYSQPVKYVSPS